MKSGRGAAITGQQQETLCSGHFPSIRIFSANTVSLHTRHTSCMSHMNCRAGLSNGLAHHLQVA